MKMLTLVCIIATSAVATAQTANTTKMKTTQSAAKAKKTKKTAETSSTTATAMPVTNEVTPSVATSTTAPAEVSTQNFFGGSITSDTSADQSSSYGTEVLQSVTMIGGHYQINMNSRTGLIQAFETATDAAYGNKFNSDLDKNNFRAMYAEPFINTTLTSFLGTDSTRLGARIRLNNRHALANLTSGIDRHYEISSNSTMAITPKFAFTLLNQVRANQHIDSRPMETRMTVLPGVGYALNDSVSFYQAAGYILNTKDGESLTNRRERMYLETGLNYAPAAVKGLNINLLTYQDKMVSSTEAGEKVSSLDLYSANNNNDGTSSNDNVVYEAIINYNF